MVVKAPAGDKTRPTSSKVREAIWSSLQTRMPCAHLLDLFAGSGAMGLEALSRGAHAVTWVDADTRAVRAIQENQREIERRAQAQSEEIGKSQAVRQDVSRFLSVRSGPYDLIFIDPPYDLLSREASVWLSAAARLLTPDGMIVLESRRGEDLAALCPPDLVVVKEKQYGDTMVSYLEPKTEP